MGGQSGKTAETRNVRDLMRRDVVHARPEDSVRRLIHLLSRHGISACPVVTKEGRLVGAVSASDLVWLSDRLIPTPGVGSEREAQARDILDGQTVADVMTPDVFGIGPDAGLDQLGAFFARTGLHRAFVVEGDTLVGLVSITDVLADLLTDDQTSSVSTRKPSSR